jgi:hypothetical protein
MTIHSELLDPIIAKYLDVEAACSRDSRLQAAPARSGQKLISGEFQKA